MKAGSRADSSDRRRTYLAIGATLLTMSLAAWLWLRCTNPLDAPSPTLSPPASTALVDAASSQQDEDSQLAEALLRREAVATASGTTSEDVSKQPLVRIRVVGEGDAPVPFATVITLPLRFDWRAVDPATAQRLEATVGLIEHLELIGHSTLADHDGIALVPRLRQWPEVCGSVEGWFGWCEVEGPEPAGGFVLRLVPDRSLIVRVTAADGTPVGNLLVGLSTSTGTSGGNAGDRSAVPIATTNAAGRAEVRHLQELQRSVGTASETLLVAYAPGLTETGVAIDLAAPPADGVDLVLPPTGALRITLRDRDGALLPTASLQVFVEEFPKPTWMRAASEGVAQLPVVALNCQFRARSYLMPMLPEGIGPGPSRPGEQAELELQLPAEGVTLRGRAVTSDNRQLSNGFVSLRGPLTDHAARDLVSTDAEARFHFELDAAAVHAPLQAALHWQPDLLSVGLNDERRDAQLSGAQLVAGARDLGDVVFAPSPVLASGRVFGVAPLPSLRWLVAVENHDGEWPYSGHIGVALHDDGSFDVLGQPPDGAPPMRLHVLADGIAPLTPLRFAAGSRDLRIELQLSSSLVARVLVHAAVLRHPKVLVFETRASGATDWGAAQAEVDGDALQVRIDDLQPGATSLRVRLAGSPEVLLALDDLQLTAGEHLVDARLQSIDLRSVHAIQLRLVDGGGAQRNVDGHWLRRRSDRVTDYAADVQHGIAWIGCQESFDVLLFADGMRPVHAFGPAVDSDVRVEPQLAIAVHLDGRPELPANCGLLLAVKSLSPGFAEQFGIEVDATRESEYLCPADSPARIHVAEPGRYRIRVLLVRDVDTTARAAELMQRELDLSIDGDHHLSLHSDDLARARSELQLPVR